MARNLGDLAKELNLARSTVSSALSGTGTISPATRRRVLDHAGQVGYVPDRDAQRLRGRGRQRRTGLVGVIVPDVVLGPYVEMTQFLFQLIEAQGLEMHLALTEFDAGLEDRAVKGMLGSRVDGIIAKLKYPRWEDVPAGHYVRRAREAGVPVVLIGDGIAGSGLPLVRRPWRAALGLVLRHLHELGHREVAYLVPTSDPFAGSLRAPVEAAMELAGTFAGMRLRVVTLREVEPGDAAGEGVDDATGVSAEAEGPVGVFKPYINQRLPERAIPVGRLLMRRALRLSPGPTAVIGFEDAIAVAAVLEAQAMGLAVPADVAVAGLSRHPISHLTPVPLTTVDQRPALFAERLLAVLLRRLDDPDADVGDLEHLEPRLVAGASTIPAGGTETTRTSAHEATHATA